MSNHSPVWPTHVINAILPFQCSVERRRTVIVPPSHLDCKKALRVLEGTQVDIDADTRAMLERAFQKGRFEFKDNDAMKDFAKNINQCVMEAREKLKETEIQIKLHRERWERVKDLFDLWRTDEEEFKREGMKFMAEQLKDLSVLLVVVDNHLKRRGYGALVVHRLRQCTHVVEEAPDLWHLLFIRWSHPDKITST
uniref:N-acetyltransferase domain-containing protein n=1 Tax=Steinernema glaseri TaxID=37863 RepID=A0A1I8A572_9BILA